jgi:hypothetical protein
MTTKVTISDHRGVRRLITAGAPAVDADRRGAQLHPGL